ncbi:MAG: hypothetical protein JNL71_09770 [Rhodospirillales bacterium]|nr:hypothetical protein [Rhodospirillales bacterium]
MRRISALIAVFLAGCAPAAPPPGLSAGLLPDGATIEIRARDRLALTAARLVLPDGTAVAADRLSASGGRVSEGRPSVGVGASGGSSSGIGTGMVFSVPFDWLSGGPRDGLVDSAARIAIPDPAAWPAIADRAKLQLEFGRPPGETRRVEMPAPGR